MSCIQTPSLSAFDSSGRQDAGLEATAQLVLKDGVIKTLSSRIAFLQFSLEEVTAEKEKLLSQPATVALQQVSQP